MSAPDTFPPAQPFPPVSELGRCLAGARGDYWRIDAATAASGEATAREDAEAAICTAREGALNDLISLLPATSMVDAAIQIGVAFSHTSILEAHDWERPEDRQELKSRHAALHRIALSILPIVAQAAGLTLAEMDCDDVPSLRASMFALGAAT